MCWPLSHFQTFTFSNCHTVTLSQTLIVILNSLLTVLATFARSLSSSDLQFTVRLKITWWRKIIKRTNNFIKTASTSPSTSHRWLRILHCPDRVRPLWLFPPKLPEREKSLMRHLKMNVLLRTWIASWRSKTPLWLCFAMSLWSGHNAVKRNSSRKSNTCSEFTLS